VATKENLLDFDYFYNGAGVGVCDLDNDGLPEVIFCGNQVDNGIFRNDGDLSFTDVSQLAGLDAGKRWSNGVTFADVNQDGLDDIYISQGGPYSARNRKNLLFINQGDLTFSEEAEKYGLADEGISTQSAFFDYDRDGDLDCFVMNESTLYGYDPVQFYRAHLEQPGRLAVSLSHLYRNEGGTFVDVSESSGIATPTFGLGLMISDINQDGWPDIYLANDYFVPDLLFINRKDGTFSERSKTHLKHMSFFGMGADIADLNNDGHDDILVMDMATKDHIRAKTLMASMDVESFDLLVNQLGMPYQYMFNSIQLNDGLGRFSNVAQMTGLAKTDWSWAPLAFDYDLDGDRDLLVTNGYRRYALDNDFKAKVTQAKLKHENNVPIEAKRALYDEMPSESLPNLLYENRGKLVFEECAAAQGLEESTFSNGGVYADLDRDGDLDVLINNIDQPALLYENSASDHDRNHFLTVSLEQDLRDRGAVVRIWHNNTHQVSTPWRVRGYMSSVEPIAHFGVSDATEIDSLIISLPDGRSYRKESVGSDQHLLITESQFAPGGGRADAPRSIFRPLPPAALNLNYTHRENEFDDFSEEVLLPYRQSTMGPSFSHGDLNGDGLVDLYVGGASGQAGSLFLQQSNGAFQKRSSPALERDLFCEDMGSVFVDVDSDKDLDLIVVSGGNAFPAHSENYRDRLYLNDGKGNFTRSPQRLTGTASAKAVAAIDIDNDGHVDLLVGNRIIPQKYPMHAPSSLYHNQSGQLIDQTEERVPELADFGIVNDILVTDLNQDGWQDFVAVGEWTRIGIFINDQGVFHERSADLGLENETGLWFSVTEIDVNKDGYPDLLIGNIGDNYKHTASSSSPFKVFASDFDDTGSLDIVLSKKYRDEFVPARGRECSSQQMPFISEKFPTYRGFAEASLTDIFEDQLDSAYQRSVTTFKSLLLINDSGKSFGSSPLPASMQSFPLIAATVVDINEDGWDDLVAAGCIYETEVETPRLDQGSGVLLINDARGRLIAPAGNSRYGFYIPGNVKFIDQVFLAKNRRLLIAASNSQGLTLFEY